MADALVLERFVLVGHSVGAAVAGEYADRRAERVPALVLVDPAGDLTRLAPRDLVVQAYEGMLYNPVPAVERYRSAGGSALIVTADMNVGPHALHELLPTLPRRAVPGTSHWLHLDRPETFNAILDDVLADRS